MDKTHILNEIKRTTIKNGGEVLGWRRFEAETGIRYNDWYGKYWARWSDAVRDAGFESNRMSEAYEDDFLLEKLVLLTRQLQCVPVQGNILMAGKKDPSFPSEKVFRRLGSKSQRVKRVIAFCESSTGYDDVIALWKNVVLPIKQFDEKTDENATTVIGYVYLLKHGSRREYKIGRTNDLFRRHGEVGIDLPEKITPVHEIKTDDPVGVEAYWHRRFASKRKEGEWFALSAEDVRAFKRWRRIF